MRVTLSMKTRFAITHGTAKILFASVATVSMEMTVKLRINAFRLTRAKMEELVRCSQPDTHVNVNQVSQGPTAKSRFLAFWPPANRIACVQTPRTFQTTLAPAHRITPPKTVKRQFHANTLIAAAVLARTT